MSSFDDYCLPFWDQTVCDTGTPAAQCQGLQLTMCEAGLFDAVTKEHVNVIGVEFDLFHLELAQSSRDPLYDEPVQRVFSGPFRLKGFFTMYETSPEAGQEGFRIGFDSSVFIARSTWEEANSPFPAESDVVRFWNLPFFRQLGVDGVNEPGNGFYFDVVKVDEEGFLHDQPYWMGIQLQLKRRTEFSPERRMANN